MLPSLGGGWFMDDLTHRIAYNPPPHASELMVDGDRLCGPMRMYSFIDGTPERYHRLVDSGFLPWWTYEKMRAAFWRPLAALTFQLDYSLWPDRSERMHLQSLTWFLGLILLSGVFYRRVMGKSWGAGLAVWLYSLNGVLIMPTIFLANRHALFAPIFAILALAAHDRWRRDRQKRWAGFAGIAFLMGLLSSEATVAAFGFLLAYAICIDPGPTKEKVKSILPYFVIIVVWRIVYNVLGYGSTGSGLYIDPVREPLRFIQAAWLRVPTLLLTVLAWPPAELFMLLSPIALIWYAILATVAVIVILWLLSPFWTTDRSARFFLLGTVLSVIPLCAALPGERNLAIPSLGAMGLIALSMTRMFDATAPGFRKSIRGKGLRILFGVILFVHLVMTPIIMWTQTGFIKQFQTRLNRVTDPGAGDAIIANRNIILVNPPCSLTSGYMVVNRLLSNQPLPAHLRILAPGLDVIRMERKDEKTLVVHPRNGYLPPAGPGKGEENRLSKHINFTNIIRNFERLVWDEHNPTCVGEIRQLTGVNIEITQITEDGRPAEAVFRFDRPLEDDSLVWFVWKEGYQLFKPPAIGQTVIVETGDTL